MDQEDRDRIAEHLVEVFDRYKALDERRAVLPPDRQQERAQVDKAIKSAVADFAETSYPLACNSALSWRRLVEPQELANEVMARRLLPRAEHIMRYRYMYKADAPPIALVQNEINWAINKDLRKERTRTTREDVVIERLAHRINDADTDEAALAIIYRQELVSNFHKELGLIETDVVSGEDACVFHPGDKNSLDHQLVAEVLRRSPLAADPANANEFEQYVRELEDLIRLQGAVDYQRRHYRCLSWFLYRLYRNTESRHRDYAADWLAGRVQLVGDRGEIKAAWNRQTCQKMAAKVLWNTCPDVRDRIQKYLENKQSHGHIGNDDVCRLISELED